MTESEFQSAVRREAEEETRKLRARVTELEAKLAGCPAGHCGWCDAEIAPVGSTPERTRELFRKHVHLCHEHPVHALAAALRRFMVVHDNYPEPRQCKCDLCEQARAALAASDEPMPSPVERASEPPVCATCLDTHWVDTERGRQMCQRCPVPCEQCRSGAFCKTTPCDCACHQRDGAGKEQSHG